MNRNLRTLAVAAVLLPLGLVPAPFAAAREAKIEQAPLVAGLKDLRQLDRKLVALAEKAAPATVSLIGGHGAGSGVVVSSDGLILSAAHVVSALPDEIQVLFPDGRSAKAKPLGADFDRDAAMLKITEPGDYPHVDLADGKPLRINDWCVALGHPGGYDPMRTPPLRLGRVLHNSSFLITDCAVISGDSGGPLFDADGRVAGIHSNIGLTLSENRHVPITVFHEQWDDLLAGKRHGKRFDTRAKAAPPADIDPDHPVLGVRLSPAEESPVKIIGVMDGSPAAKAGLLEGDVITRLNGKPVGSRDQFIESVANLKPGRRIKLGYQRDGKSLKARIRLARFGDLPKPSPDGKAKGSNNGDLNPDEGLDDFLDKMLENARDGELRLELSPADIERFGGMGRIMDLLKKRLGQSEDGDKAEETPEEHEPAADKEENQPKPKAGANKGSFEDAAAKLLERALKNGGQLEFTPEDLENIGGFDDLMKQLQGLADKLDPELLGRLMRGAAPSSPDDFFLSSMKALEPVARKTAGSTVEVLSNDEPVALGTAVGDDWILTKDTETREGSVSVRAGDIIVGAKEIRRFPKYDLALFQIETGDIRPVTWKLADDSLPLGSLLTVIDADDKPAGIGLVSVKTRVLGEIGFLGIEMDDPTDNGIAIRNVIPDGAAAKAGLIKGDVITRIDDNPATTPADFARLIRGRKAGDGVRLEWLHDGKHNEAEIKLGVRPQLHTPDPVRKMNKLSGPMSEKTAGFPEALQHDIPITPVQCGSPLLDLDGNCVGINVSRAGRVKTLAIPASTITRLLDQARGRTSAEAAPETAAEQPAVSPAELDEISDSIQQIRRSLKALEERLGKHQTR